jgi:putative DNA primase/helicase
MTLLEAAERKLRQLEGKRNTASDGVILVNATDLKPEPIRWLWRLWLALGKLHILAGAAGQGKTTLLLAIIGVLTGGRKWPDGTRCTEPGNVLIWSGEDDPADTLLPRLLAMGADPRRVFFVTGARIDGEHLPFDPARDLGPLMSAAASIGNIRLLMVDPIVSAVLGDSHKNTEVRRALQPLVDLAAALDCAVVGVSHFSKGSAGRDPTERVTGSIAFGAVARVVLVAAKVRDEDGNERRILARAKSNIGPDDGAFEYAIAQTELLAHPGVFASRIDWGAAVEGTARELLAEPEDSAVEEASAQDGAADFLRQVLGTDTVPVKTVEAEAKAAGIAWRTIRRAADTLHVVKRKGGMGAGWYWALPKVATKMPNMSNPEGWTPSAPSGDLATFEADPKMAKDAPKMPNMATPEGWTPSAPSDDAEAF